MLHVLFSSHVLWLGSLAGQPEGHVQQWVGLWICFSLWVESPELAPTLTRHSICGLDLSRPAPQMGALLLLCGWSTLLAGFSSQVFLIYAFPVYQTDFVARCSLGYTQQLPGLWFSSPSWTLGISGWDKPVSRASKTFIWGPTPCWAPWSDRAAVLALQMSKANVWDSTWAFQVRTWPVNLRAGFC